VVARTHLERRHLLHLRHPKHQLLAKAHQELEGGQVFSPKLHPLGVRIQVKKRLVPIMALRLTPKGVKMMTLAPIHTPKVVKTYLRVQVVLKC
jgi:hypothetical protein